MLEKLTKKEEELMEQVKNKWLDGIFKNKFEFDEKEIRKGIKWLYRFSKLKEPQIIILDSPLACQYSVNQMGMQVGSQVWRQVESQVGRQVWSQVESQVGSQVGSQVWSQVGRQVWMQARMQVGSQVWRQVESQVGRQVWSQVGRQARMQVESQELVFFEFSSYGNIRDYGWLSFYDFFERIGKIKNPYFTKFKNLIKAGVYDMIQTENFCFVSKLPNLIKRDNRDRLHSEKTSAIKFNDGYELFFLNGINFEKDLWQKIVDKTITAKEILKIENIEKKMTAFSKIEPKKFLDELEAKKINENERGDQLYLVDKSILGTRQDVKIGKYKDWSTDRIYVDFMRPECETIDEALAKRHKYSLAEWRFVKHA